MKTFIITYNFEVYKPSNIHIYEQQKNYFVIVAAEDINQAKNIFKSEYNKNPFYFNFKEL